MVVKWWAFPFEESKPGELFEKMHQSCRRARDIEAFFDPFPNNILGGNPIELLDNKLFFIF